ncbi:MAG: ATP-dependent RecD-like DNA helicase [Deltaproteobacteria bacterium]|nr:ATP-dependent RecD-like DNA helicase [Deltaproteobacteria bacterium]
MINQGMDEQTLTGTLERITYQNPENHFLIGRLLCEGQRQTVTIKGSLFNVFEGQALKLWGKWEEHHSYGKQFNVSGFAAVEPTSLAGIERYLASGVIKGVGKAWAQRIVKAFGAETLDIIDSEPEKLLEVPKMSRKILENIRESWEEQKAVREIMVFLHSLGISQAYADRIFRTYGFSGFAVLKENPYRLAMDVSGIGFRIADGIAAKLGIDRLSPQRAEAGVVYTLEETAGEGHTCYPKEKLVDRAAEILEIPRDNVLQAVASLQDDNLLKPYPPEQSPNPRLFRPRMDRAERNIAASLTRILQGPPFTAVKDIPARLAAMEHENAILLDPQQKKAVTAALDHKVLILTGGPGTGKTTIIRFILGLVADSIPSISLAAPTGKAAKRLTETTGRTALTLHRLLETSPKGFERNADNPLEAELLIVDECSMIDTLLMESLLDGLQDHARLVLVGDVDQLPSVGAGQVLGDMIASRRFEVVVLDKIHRQSAASRITSNAHLVRKGVVPDLSRPPGEALVDFYFMRESEPEKIVEKIILMATRRIPERFGLDPKLDVQIITPMHRGPTGVANLNRVLQDALNPSGAEVLFGENRYRVGDRVMQIKNNYEKKVFNGDVGEITQYKEDGGMLSIQFDEREISYERKELDTITLGYAITVHKSQGSEYPAVIIPFTTHHAIMLQRNLFYTALTRGKKLVVLIGTDKAVQMAVHNARREERFTALRDRLEEPPAESPQADGPRPEEPQA